jgi:hypothetical protein
VPWAPGGPPGTSPGSQPKAARTQAADQGAWRDASAAALTSAYEQLRGIAGGGLGGGWRYGAAVLAASGMAAWMAGAATWAAQCSPADRRDGAAAQAQAERPLSAPDQSLPAICAEGGENAGSACPPLPPAATSELITAMAQLTLHHARAQARAASAGLSPASSSFPDSRESIPP